MQKKEHKTYAISAKKSRKYIFNFEIHTKKSKMEKRKHIYLDFFAFISPVHLKPKNSYKKRQKCKKKLIFF